LLFLVFVFFLPTAAATDYPNALISDGYIILRDETPHNFHQGYAVSLKGFGVDNVFIEFICTYSTPTTLGSVVLKEGETVQCYRRGPEGTNLVLMMTLDKLYLNNSQMIAGFSYVYQLNDTNFGTYSGSGDWILYADTLDDPTTPGRPHTPPGNGTEIEPDLIAEPLIILMIGVAALAVIAIAVFSKRGSRKKQKGQKK